MFLIGYSWGSGNDAKSSPLQGRLAVEQLGVPESSMEHASDIDSSKPSLSNAFKALEVGDPLSIVAGSIDSSKSWLRNALKAAAR
jgi:hypothetical protein